MKSLPLVFLAAALAAHADEPRPVYLPTVILYGDGQYVASKQIAAATLDVKACIAATEAAIDELRGKMELPKGGELIGVCIPLPYAQPHKAKAPPKGSESL
jgi:hypothetical protein